MAYVPALTAAELRQSPLAVTGTFWQATQPVSIAATVAISAAALPLPAGASTETTLAALNTKTPALGQATMANSRPVVLASNQSALAVTGTFWQATQPVSGTVSISGAVAVTGPLTDAQLRAAALPVTVGNFPATQAVSIASMPSTPVTGTFWPATQPVSGTFWQATQPVSIASMPSTPVTGTFWQATQPVSGPLTDAQLRASPVPVTGSFSAASVEAVATFRGRASTYRMIGRAGTTPRRLLSIFNAVGSGKVVHINQIAIDVIQTAAIAVTVVPAVIRTYRVTAAPTGGTALTKNAKDTALTSNAGITLLGDASADGTNSATALAATTVAGAHLTQEFNPRLITAAGYEMFDRAELLEGKDIVLRPGEGLVLTLDLTLATQDPAGNSTIASIDWYEV